MAALRILFAALLLAVPLAAPAASETVLRRNNTSEPASLDPHKVNGQWENNIISDMFVGLMTYSAEGTPIPGAAESFTVSEDGTVYTFLLREGHVWSDGTPVTAEDFVFSLRRILDPATAAEYASITYVIKNAFQVNTGALPLEALGVRAVDARTLEITLEHPAPYFPQLLTHYTTYPVPAHVIAAHGTDWTNKGVMVSNGAYMLAEWRPDDYVKLVRNPLFYEAGEVAIDAVYFYPITDQEAALKRFRAGELDISNNFPRTQYEWLKQNLPDETRVAPFMLSMYVTINTTRAPFNDIRVRQALGLAIDREFLAEKVLRVGEVPAYAIVPAGIANYPGTAQLGFKDTPMEARREAARALLAEAGFGPDNPLTAQFAIQNTADTRRIGVAIQDMWRQIGVTVTLDTRESKTHYANLRQQNFDVAWAGWIADFNDPKNYLFLAETRSGDMNYTKWSNADFDRLVQAADVERDSTRRGELLAQAEQILLDEAAMIPVYYGTSRNLVQAHVTGWVDNIVDVHRTRYLSLAADRPRAEAGQPYAVRLSDWIVSVMDNRQAARGE